MPDQGPKTFTCEKYNVTMLASKADETCSRRFAISLSDTDTFHNFDKCRTCNRGAILHKGGKHKPPAGYRFGSLNQKGATMAVCHKHCDKHGAYTTGPTGTCPVCKKEKEGSAPVPATARRGRSASKSLEVAGGGTISISLDLSRFPKLHSRLVAAGLNAMFAELETKA